MFFSIIFMIWPIIGVIFLFGYIFKNLYRTEHKNLKTLVLPLALIFAIFGYCMYFNGRESDLTRYYDSIDLMNYSSLIEYIKNDNLQLYTRDVLFYFVKMTGNVNTLAFIVGLIIYSITFYVLFDMVERSDRKFKTYELLLLGLFCVGIISPYKIICNVRCVLSYVLISFAAYRDLIQKKKNIITLLLYIIPLGLHSSAIIVILIRLMSTLLKKFNKIAFVISLSLPKIIDFAHDHIKIGLGTIGNIINGAINKAYYYLHWTEGGWATEIESSVSNKIFRITGAILLISLIIFVFFKYNTKEKKKEVTNNSMINYLLFISMIALGTLSIKTGAFWRFETIVVLFSPVIFVTLLEKKEHFEKTIWLYYLFGIFHLLLNLVYQINNLSPEGFMITMKNFFMTPLVKILYELLKGLLNLF